MKRLILFVLVAVLLLMGGCRRPVEEPETPASGTTTTTARSLDVVGEWRISLPVDALVDAAANHGASLRPLGESNVSLLRTAEPYVSPLDTEATLEAVLTLNEDKSGELLILHDAMKTTGLTVVSEYSPLLKNVVAPVVEALLPSDISVPMTYEIADGNLTIHAVSDADTAVVLRVEENTMSVVGVVSRTLSEEDRLALEKLLKEAAVRRG